MRFLQRTNRILIELALLRQPITEHKQMRTTEIPLHHDLGAARDQLSRICFSLIPQRATFCGSDEGITYHTSSCNSPQTANIPTGLVRTPIARSSNLGGNTAVRRNSAAPMAAWGRSGIRGMTGRLSS